MISNRHWLCVLAAILLNDAPLRAQEAAPPAPKITSEVLLGGLAQPFGVALRPGKTPPQVFVSESGAGKILRINPDVPNASQPIITGFPLAEFAAGLAPGKDFELGPTGIAFLDVNTLVVGEAGRPDATDLVQLYKLPADDKMLPLASEAPAQKLGPVAAAADLPNGAGNFLGVATGASAIFVTAHGADKAAVLFRSEANIATASQLKPLIRTQEVTGVESPTAVIVSDRGELVASQMGQPGPQADSELIFFHPRDGKKLLQLKTGLRDVVALAYHPKNKRLYALDAAWSKPEEAGLYRLDAEIRGGKQIARPVKMLPLSRPVGMAFDSGGALYVTIWGEGNSTAMPATGQVLKLTGDL